MVASELETFANSLPHISDFADVADASAYAPLPNGWLVGTADVVDSTGAISAGRYKAVNMVGASVIAAVQNVLATRHLPFVFGGDGAAFVIPRAAAGDVAAALAAVSVWAQEEIGLELRAALVPVADIRGAGDCDVRLARFAVAPELSYTMFAGGGVAWAEARMKAGDYMVEPAAPGTRPDLNGLSCRWQPIQALRGRIASLLVVRNPRAEVGNYRALVREIITYIHDREIEEGRPVSFETTRFALSSRGLDLEIRASRGPQPYWRRWLKLAPFYFLVWYLFVRNRRVGSFDPVRYRHETVRNTDFRKFDDGLKLTIDCSETTYEGLREILEGALAGAVANYGMHAQETALMTCIVPSHLGGDHLHLVDGAEGGYAKAAELLKAQLADGKILSPG